MAKLFNNVGEQTTTTGTGTITLTGDIDESYATFAEAGAVDGNVITYKLSEGDDFEIGRGTIGGTVTTLSRDTVLLSKIGGTAGTTKMNLAGAAEVRIVMAAEDRIEPPTSSANNAVVRWSGTGARAVNDSAVSISDAGVVQIEDSAGTGGLLIQDDMQIPDRGYRFRVGDGLDLDYRVSSWGWTISSFEHADFTGDQTYMLTFGVSGTQTLRMFGTGGSDGGILFSKVDDGNLRLDYPFSSTDTVETMLTLQRETGETPEAGIGAGISLNVETAAGNIETGATIRTVCWDTGSAAEEFSVNFGITTQGAPYEVFYIANWSGQFGRVSFNFPHTNIGFDLSTNGASNWFFGCDQTLGGTGADFGISNGSLSFVKSLLIQGDTNNVCIGGGIIPPRQLTVFSDPAATNTVTPLIQLRQGSSGTPANGIGTSIEFAVETAADNFETGATIEAVTTSVASTAENFDLVTKIMAAGATAAEKFRVKSDGRYVTQGGHDEIVVSLTDGATVALNAALGNVFHLTAGGNRTISVPTNAPAAGRTQKIIIRHQASGAGRTLTLTTGSAGAFRFGTDITGLSATTSGLVDYIGCVWNQAADRWDVVSYVKGF